MGFKEYCRISAIWIGFAVLLGLVASVTTDPVIIFIIGLGLLSSAIFSTIRLT